jgi:hypothetical protein
MTAPRDLSPRARHVLWRLKNSPTVPTGTVMRGLSPDECAAVMDRMRAWMTQRIHALESRRAKLPPRAKTRPTDAALATLRAIEARTAEHLDALRQALGAGATG